MLWFGASIRLAPYFHRHLVFAPYLDGHLVENGKNDLKSQRKVPFLDLARGKPAESRWSQRMLRFCLRPVSVQGHPGESRRSSSVPMQAVVKSWIINPACCRASSRRYLAVCTASFCTPSGARYFFFRLVLPFRLGRVFCASLVCHPDQSIEWPVKANIPSFAAASRNFRLPTRHLVWLQPRICSRNLLGNFLVDT